MEICSIIIFFGICLTFNLVIPQASGSCDMINRIKKRDVGLDVTATESPCQMIVKSNDQRQVVAVINNFQKNCIDVGDMTISDGNLTNNTVINRKCRAQTISFASRNFGLIITLTSPYQPFDIDLHLINTEIQYTSQHGSIRSQRFPGFEGGEKNLTPNNFQCIYRIIPSYNISIHLTFTEFRVQPSPAEIKNACTRDVVRILGDSQLLSEICGDGVQISPTTVIAKQLELSFTTDDLTTYTGFSATYSVCKGEVDGSNSTGSIEFSEFPLVERTCIFIIRLRKQEKILLMLDLSTQRNCNDSIMITRDEKTTEPAKCNGFHEVTAREVKIVFNLVKEEKVFGNYSIRSSSTDQETASNGNHSSLSGKGNATGVVVGVVVTVVLLIILSIVIVTLIYKRRKNIRSREAERRMENMSVNVYEDKEDYDHLNVKRDHKRTSNDQNSNVYGRVIPSEGNNEYAVANKNGQEPEVISANQYGTGAFGTEYEEATICTSNKKQMDQNLYE